MLLLGVNIQLNLCVNIFIWRVRTSTWRTCVLYVKFFFFITFRSTSVLQEDSSALSPYIADYKHRVWLKFFCVWSSQSSGAQFRLVLWLTETSHCLFIPSWLNDVVIAAYEGASVSLVDVSDESVSRNEWTRSGSLVLSFRGWVSLIMFI